MHKDAMESRNHCGEKQTSGALCLTSLAGKRCKKKLDQISASPSEAKPCVAAQGIQQCQAEKKIPY